jgi:hypothetical protein
MPKPTAGELGISNGPMTTHDAVSSVLAEKNGTSFEPTGLDTHTTRLTGFRKFRALLIAVPALVLTACGVNAAPTPGATTVMHTESPTATVSGGEPPTPFQTLGDASTATVKPEATPFVLPPVDSITNPSPSEIPQTPVTTDQVKADIAKVVSDQGSGLTPDVETQLDNVLATAADKTRDTSLRTKNYASLVVVFYDEYAQTFTDPTAQQDAYKTAFDTYQLATGPNGVGPSAKAQIDAIILKAHNAIPSKTP